MLPIFSSICVRSADSVPLAACAELAQLGKWRSKFPFDVTLLEQMALDLAAGGLRNAFDRHNLRRLPIRRSD